MPPRRAGGSAGTSDAFLRDLHKSIADGDVAPLYLVAGDDEFRRSQIARNLGRWIVPEAERDFSLTVLDGAECSASDVVTRLESGSLGFFDSDRRVVTVANCPFLGARPPGGKDSVACLTRRIEDGLPGSTTLIIEANAIDNRMGLTKAVKAAGVVLEFPLLEGASALRDFVLDRFRRARIKADPEAVDYILSVCAEDTRQLSNEVAKIATYVGDGGLVTLQAVREVVSVSRGAVTFDLTDAISERDVETALDLVRRLLAQGESPVLLAVLLANRFRLIYQARVLMDERAEAQRLAGETHYSGRFRDGVARLFSEDVKALFPDDKSTSLAKQHPFVVFKTLQAAQRFTTPESAEALMRLAELDFALKTTTGLEDVALLELTVIELCGGKGKGAGDVLTRAIV